MPLNTKKLIVYLDQNLISDIVKAKEQGRDPRGLLGLYDLLNRGMAEEKFVCPMSWFHREEGSLTALDPKIQKYLRHFGQVDFLTAEEIEGRQFYNAALRFLGREPYYAGWHKCLDEDPDKRIRRFHIDASMDLSVFNYRQQRAVMARALDDARVKQAGVTFAEQLALERSELPEYLCRRHPYGVSTLFQDMENGRLHCQEFLGSSLWDTIPSADISSQLFASLLTHYGTREVRTGDATDIQMISALLPYCHVLTTDKFMKTLTCNLKLDAKYGARVFSGGSRDLNELVQYLEVALKTVPPANIPIFSLLVVPDAKAKEHLWDFFRNIMMVCGRGGEEWVEIVNIDDGTYPRYAHPRYGLMPDPSFFFEFDDEVETAVVTPDFVESCARTLRGPATVVIDSYARIGNDFIDRALGAVVASWDSVPRYNWRVVRRA